ncbi:MAG: MOSC domain-containing protein [Acidobacteria bacterium]|nr:MAG: MOSC domain-containing protein [Acidobacteriota bacterium]REK07952.1 MAG: MOSC domain-containing protein [Acidobacteriota bacterium]
MIGRVAEIWRYPVKSLQGERIEHVELSERGVPGDRCWAVRDEERGGIRGAKRFAGLMQLAARFPAEPDERGSSPAVIRFPDGSEIRTGDPTVSERLSEFLESPVTLWPLVPAEVLDHYRRGAPVHEDFDTELRAIFARTPDEPLPDLSRFPPEVLEFESPPGTYFDASPLLLLTRRSLESMARSAPGSRFDVRRFRPNFVLEVEEGDGSAHPELDWVGRQISLGRAVVEVEMRCPRCVMTTHPQGDLPRDPKVMRALVQEVDGDLGVYARVVQPGAVAEGAALRLL